MSKWADYVITKVRFKEERTHILAVRLREDTGEDNLGNEQEWKRQDVVDSLEKDKKFVTGFDAGDKIRKGEDVHIVPINNQKFIRTDKNKTEKDNLGELPEF